MRDISSCDNPTWRREKNGDRTCSYCGSLHPTDAMDIMSLYTQHIEGYTFEPSDKGYKLYMHRPGVRSASDGGIKFYTKHIPEDDTEFRWLYSLCRARYITQFNERWGPGNA